MNRAASVLVGAGLWLAATSAWAEDARQCVDAHERAQLKRDAGDLLAARDAASACSMEGCPAGVRDECRTFRDQFEQRIPRFKVIVRDKEKQPVSGLLVLLGKRLVSEKSTSDWIEANPGKYPLKVVTGRKQAHLMSVLLREGERARLVEVDLPYVMGPRKPAPAPPPPAKPAPAPTPPVPVAPTPVPPAPVVPAGEGTVTPMAWGALGTGAAGLVVFGVFQGLAASANGDLDPCGATCAAEDERDAHVKQVSAFAGLGAGVGALGAAAALFLTSDDGQPGGRERAHTAGLVTGAATGVLGLGAIGAGVAVGTMAKSDYDATLGSCTSGLCSADAVATQNDAIEQADTGTAILAAGAVGAALGTAILVTTLLEGGDDDASARVEVGPTGAALSGRF